MKTPRDSYTVVAVLDEWRFAETLAVDDVSYDTMSKSGKNVVVEYLLDAEDKARQVFEYFKDKLFGEYKFKISEDSEEVPEGHAFLGIEKHEITLRAVHRAPPKEEE